VKANKELVYEKADELTIYAIAALDAIYMVATSAGKLIQDQTVRIAREMSNDPVIRAELINVDQLAPNLIERLTVNHKRTQLDIAPVIGFIADDREKCERVMRMCLKVTKDITRLKHQERRALEQLAMILRLSLSDFFPRY